MTPSSLTKLMRFLSLSFKPGDTQVREWREWGTIVRENKCKINETAWKQNMPTVNR